MATNLSIKESGGGTSTVYEGASSVVLDVQTSPLVLSASGDTTGVTDYNNLNTGITQIVSNGGGKIILLPGVYTLSQTLSAQTNVPFAIEGYARAYIENNGTTGSVGVLIVPCSTFTAGNYLMSFGSSQSNSGAFRLAHVELNGAPSYGASNPWAVAAGLYLGTLSAGWNIPTDLIDDVKCWNMNGNGITYFPNGINGPHMVRNSHFGRTLGFGVSYAEISARLDSCEFYKCGAIFTNSAGSTSAALYNTGGALGISGTSIGSPSRLTASNCFFQDSAGCEVYALNGAVTLTGCTFSFASTGSYSLASQIGVDTNSQVTVVGAQLLQQPAIPFLTMYGNGFVTLQGIVSVMTGGNSTVPLVSYQSGFTKGQVGIDNFTLWTNGNYPLALPTTPSGTNILIRNSPTLVGVGLLWAPALQTSAFTNPYPWQVQVTITVGSTSTTVYKNGGSVFSGTNNTVYVVLNTTDTIYVSQTTNVSWAWSGTGYLTTQLSVSTTPQFNINSFPVAVDVMVGTTGAVLYKNSTQITSTLTSSMVEVMLMPNDSIYVSSTVGVTYTCWTVV